MHLLTNRNKGMIMSNVYIPGSMKKINTKMATKNKKDRDHALSNICKPILDDYEHKESNVLQSAVIISATILTIGGAWAFYENWRELIQWWAL